MQQMRLDSKDGLANGWKGAGVGDARNLPESVRPKAPVSARADEDSVEQTNKRSWFGATVRFARNALTGVLLLATVPVAVVGVRSQFLRYYDYRASSDRVRRADRLRPLMGPKDASITPMQAGLAFDALQAGGSNEHHATVQGTAPVEWPWRKHKATPGMFVSTGGPTPVFDGPSPNHIIEIVSRGFTAEELAYLRDIAEGPVWKNYDMVAAAPYVDLLFGQYQLPSRASAFVPARRVLFAGTKELAYANMSRAAYYLAKGDPVRAEAALKSTVSFGFALIDNATSTLDAMIGAVIVNIGRSGLEQFYIATHRSTDLVRDVPVVSVKTGDYWQMGRKFSAADVHQRLLHDAMDNSLSRGVRLERLDQLSLSSCKNIPEMIFGPSDDTRGAFDKAKKSLARYPSERAMLDAVLDETNHVPDQDLNNLLPGRFLMGAAMIASTVTQNPRFATCTRVALSYW